VTAAIREFTATYERVKAEIEMLEPRASLIAATRLRDAIGSIEIEVGSLRANAMDRVRVTYGLSLAALAQLFGMSKQRVDQLVRRAHGNPVRKKRRRPPPAPQQEDDQPCDDSPSLD
jgi:DNA-binding transcriptional regulator YiaG